ncbi:MAG: cytochrome c oxidase subunit II [Caldilineaceae bacterium]|nr:cytochrome c oxidase subunit II [Caldilineaceae bacterium]
MIHVDRYEQAWIRITILILIAFIGAVIVAGVASGIQVPSAYQRVDPKALSEPGSPWAEPGLRELAPGKYEAYILSQIWSFVPNEMRVPVGSEVTFYVTSRDVQHGFKIVDTNINMMVLPGQVAKLKTTFARPGTYNIICHEYCGTLHHTMYAQIIVE